MKNLLKTKLVKYLEHTAHMFQLTHRSLEGAHMCCGSTVWLPQQYEKVDTESCNQFLPVCTALNEGYWKILMAHSFITACSCLFD